MRKVFEKACPARWFFLLLALVLTPLPPLAGAGEYRELSQWQARNDLLEIPAVESDKAASSLLLDIAKAGERLVAVGERGHIIYSDDNGKSWEQAEVPVMVTLTALDFSTPEKGWAVGHDGVVLHTEDSGETWVKQFDAFEANQMSLEYARSWLRPKRPNWNRPGRKKKPP